MERGDLLLQIASGVTDERDYAMSVRLCQCNGGGYVALSENEDTERDLPLLQMDIPERLCKKNSRGIQSRRAEDLSCFLDSHRAHSPINTQL